mmetsp:Transcript_24215/g.52227  ORF Transcript_24215/g.52227 Transcript_24215/m.52227 type:complete len:397 (-) Transcript_24215:26-1216(-)
MGPRHHRLLLSTMLLLTRAAALRIHMCGASARAGFQRCAPAPVLMSGPSTEEQIERLFFDRAELSLRSGAGGNGALSFSQKRPSGGSGGAGGSVYLECTEALNTLAHLRGRSSVQAERGSDAEGRQSGSSGADAVVYVPPNCLVTDKETNQTIGELKQAGQRMLLCRGGEGGQGNGEVFRRMRSESKLKVPPGGTERRRLLLSMTLVADVGLVGHPNAGKSTLLRSVTRAEPKVADYPFTTLVPNLGVCNVDARGGGNDGRQMVWLDIPGLIQGAHSGRGLGLAFLRHTERCRLLLHLVDGESDDPVKDVLSINRELTLFSPELARKPQVVVLTKADLPHVEKRVCSTLEGLRAAVRHQRVLSISSRSGLNLQELQRRTQLLLRQIDEREQSTELR